MLTSLKKSHDSEKKLAEKCQELNESIAENAGKIKTVIQIA